MVSLNLSPVTFATTPMSIFVHKLALFIDPFPGSYSYLNNYFMLVNEGANDLISKRSPNFRHPVAGAALGSLVSRVIGCV